MFEVGDHVFLKLQPYVQSSLAPRANQKLTFKFFGSFPIVQKVGTIAYKLELPLSYAIHPIFHVSHLKKVVGSKIQITPWPQQFSEHQIPEKILQRHLITRGVLMCFSCLPNFLHASSRPNARDADDGTRRRAAKQFLLMSNFPGGY
jgi:hypothetical protein